MLINIFINLEGKGVYMKRVGHRNCFIITSISVLLCLATVACAGALILNRMSLKKQHDIKWQDYDDCGIF